jgi:serine/threonine protein kinase
MSAALNTQTLPGIQLPFSFSSIGIPFTWISGTTLVDSIFHQLEEIQQAFQLVRIPVGDRIIPTGSVFHLGGISYTLFRRMGCDSSFGQVYSIKDTQGTEYVCKLQPIRTRHHQIQVLREYAIQHIVYETTKDPNTHEDCPYAPRIYKVARALIQGGWYSVCIQEKLNGGTFSDILFTQNPSYESVVAIVVKVARKLQNLWRLYQFNHCDLHTDNVMIHNGNVYLIDFGKSNLRVGGEILQTEHRRASEGRDMTHMIAYMRYIDSLSPTSALSQTIVPNALYETLRQASGAEGKPHWGALEYFTINENPSGTPEHILQEFNQGPAFITDRPAQIPGSVSSIQRFQLRIPGIQQPVTFSSGMTYGFLLGALAIGAGIVGFRRRGGRRTRKGHKKMKSHQGRHTLCKK